MGRRGCAVTTARSGPARGRLHARSISHGESVLYGAFVWARRVLDGPKRRFPAESIAERERSLSSSGAGFLYERQHPDGKADQDKSHFETVRHLSTAPHTPHSCNPHETQHVSRGKVPNAQRSNA